MKTTEVTEGSFVIVNDMDRPSEDHIAQVRDGLCYYIHPRLREKWKGQGMSIAWATLVEDFGIEISIKDGVFYGFFENESKANYPDGKRRFWQGAAAFNFSYPEPGNAEATSNTPRTDACAKEVDQNNFEDSWRSDFTPYQWVPVEFARELERELNEALRAGEEDES